MAKFELVGCIPRVKVIVDPQNKYPGILTQPFMAQYGLFFEMMRAMDLEIEPMNAIWERYVAPYAENKIVLPASVKNDVYSYTGDPDLYPIMKLTTEVKGYPEALLVYPHDWVIYQKEGEYLTIGRMD